MTLFRWIAAGLLMLGIVRSEGARTEARLLLAKDSVKTGGTVLAAVKLKMPPHWHTYWSYAGDAGSPTKIDWELPAGITAGEIRWPVPEKLVVPTSVSNSLTTYIYEGEVGLLVPLKIAPGMKSGSVELKAKVSWLECEESCIPGRGTVQATLNIGTEEKASADAGFIAQEEGKLPQSGAGLNIVGSWGSPPTAETRLLQIEVGKEAATADFYPGASEDFDVGGATERTATGLVKKVTKSGAKWPSVIKGLVVFGTGAERKGYEVALNLESGVAGGIATTGGNAGAGTTAPAAAAGVESLWGVLGLAFLGGLILNIMPCVLPVIALKILGFVSQAGQNPGRVRQLGLIYALGVLVSFLALAGFVIGVKAAGGLASWGMQFQNAKFLVVMIVLVTLVALNLFGVFEVSLGGNAMGAAGNLAARDGNAGAFFNGVLATALATPCTAPFLGAALGFAFTQSGAIVVLIFLTVGLGLAAPYVVLCWRPEWLKFLPKPGAWMEKFKVAMGFPMLATVVWLFWVALAHFSNDGALWLGLFLVLVAFSAWMWGEFVQRGTKRRGLAMVMSGVVVILAYVLVLEGELHWRAQAMPVIGELENKGGIAWERWSTEAVARAQAEGKPVLVDFTAIWCAVCQVNKRTSIEIDSVRAKLKEIGAVALIGDYGSEDPVITRELIRNKRAAVPLVLVYPGDPAAAPMVLPAVLTPGIMLNALDEAARLSRKKSG